MKMMMMRRRRMMMMMRRRRMMTISWCEQWQREESSRSSALESMVAHYTASCRNCFLHQRSSSVQQPEADEGRNAHHTTHTRVPSLYPPRP